MVKNSYTDLIKTFEFVINLLEKISIRREHHLLLNQCTSMKEYLDSLNELADFWEFRIDLLILIDQLSYIINAEIRFFLFPIPSIKEETYELGKRYMNNFLEWYKPQDDHSIEEIMKILNDELYLLYEAKIILEKMDLVKTNKS